MTKEETKQLSEVMQAWLAGKQIQCKEKDDERDGYWEDIDEPSWNIRSFRYRVKPENEYRPYKDLNEFYSQGYAKHNQGDKLNDRFDTATATIITNEPLRLTRFSPLSGDTIQFGLSMDQLYASYTWPDGTPCGVKNE